MKEQKEELPYDLGKYTLHEQVGDGGQAFVYKAWHKELRAWVAIKFLKERLMKRADIRERFKQEARLQFQLQHPNIVRVLEILEEDGQLGMVMDWVEGDDLSDYLDSHPEGLPLEEVERILLPILLAVGYAHQHGIVHRDLKPSNILLQRHKDIVIPKVMDFGIAKSLDQLESQTKTNAILGTPAYIAPEQVRSTKDVDHRADIYSLGVTLYQMLSGHVPFQGEDPFLVAMAHITEEPPPFSSFGLTLPPALEMLTRQAIAKMPEERPASCEEFADLLWHTFSSLRQQDATPSPALFSPVSPSAALPSGSFPHYTSAPSLPLPSGSFPRYASAPSLPPPSGSFPRPIHKPSKPPPAPSLVQNTLDTASLHRRYLLLGFGSAVTLGALWLALWFALRPTHSLRKDLSKTAIHTKNAPPSTPRSIANPSQKEISTQNNQLTPQDNPLARGIATPTPPPQIRPLQKNKKKAQKLTEKACTNCLQRFKKKNLHPMSNTDPCALSTLQAAARSCRIACREDFPAFCKAYGALRVGALFGTIRLSTRLACKQTLRRKSLSIQRFGSYPPASPSTSKDCIQAFSK